MEWDEVREVVSKALMFFLGILIMALTYNIAVVPNDFVTGGVGGMSVIFKGITNLNPVYFIYIMNIILIVVSFIFLGKKKTHGIIIGSILYPILISVTTPLSNLIMPYVQFDNIFITIILTGGLLGLGSALVYKSGYSTGGGDVIMYIITKYAHITEGKSTLIMNVIIVLLGGVILGVHNVVYSIMIIYIITTITDKMMIGVSDSKMFYIHSTKNDEIRKYVLDNLSTGVTLFKTKGGLKKVDREMLMVVVPTRDYYLFRQKILELDKDAFFIVSDCYDVTGGMKRKNLPFI